MTEGVPYQEDDASKLAGELFSGKLGVGEALSKLRTRLLDLSMRNRLLNYRHPKGRSFQFTSDPDLNLLFERLEEGKTVPIAYVPDPPVSRYEGGKKPEVRASAREQSIGTSVDIAQPTASTAYKRLPALQVLHYPVDLERLVRKVSSEARTVIEETGTNMLYLIFGFLEYYDSDDSEKAVHAPLLSMPVNLLRANLDAQSRTYTYELSYSGEDIAENFTLREKLKQFRLELPDLDDEDTPEAYFRKIQLAVSKRRNWTVKRRLSLGFLSFGKLAIWADLDPEKSAGLLKSDLLRNIFEGGRIESSGTFHAEDYVIDGHADGELPLIYDADSSQHSAIIDVKNGKSLVINGPPGTGKSQTITNIVASALADGKKVLFVSEKLAALEVVKQRLEAAGLGDFCLELHSHKTQKKQLLESIEQRMVRKFAHPAGYSTRIDVLRERRKALNTYAEILGSRYGSKLDLTVHEVFWAAERRRHALGVELDGTSGVSIFGAAGWTPEQVDRCRMVLGDAAGALGELGCSPMQSPWLGFFPELLIRGDEIPILRVVDQALQQAEVLEVAASSLESLFPGTAWTMVQIQNGSEAVSALRAMPVEVDTDLLGQMFSEGVRSFDRVTGEASRLTTMLAQVRGLRERASASLARLDIGDPQGFQSAVWEVRLALSDVGYGQTPEELELLGSQFSEALAKLAQLAGSRSVKVPRDPQSLLQTLDVASSNQDLATLLGQPATFLTKVGDEGATAAREVRLALEQIDGVLRACRVPACSKVDELQALLDGRGMPELIPEAVVDAAALEELRRLATSGWHDWTAEQFSSKAREIGELLFGANQSSDELRAFFARVGIPVETTPSGLEGIDTLLAVAEASPQELLGSRTPGLERQDFADIAIRAEDAHKAVLFRASKVTASFHLDTLPDDEAIRGHVKVFRRGDGFFRFLRSDWRSAKAAYQGCARDAGKLKSAEMGEKFAAVLSWRAALTEYTGNEQFRSVLGSLFSGLDTDFAKVRRLHGWTRGSTTLLLATDLAPHVNLNAMPEQHMSLLAGGANKVRAWVGKLQQLSRAVALLPGVDPALARVRRVDELFVPLDAYAKGLIASCSLLKSVVRPTASVARAVELVELHRRISEHGALLRALIQAPSRLCAVGAKLGLSASTIAYQDVRSSVLGLDSRARLVRDVGEQLGQMLGTEETIQTGVDVLRALASASAIAGRFLADKGVPTSGLVAGLLNVCSAQGQLVSTLVKEVKKYSKPGVATIVSVGAVQAALDAESFLATITRDQGFSKTFGVFLRGDATDEGAVVVCLDWASTARQCSTNLPFGAGDALLRVDARVTAAAAADALEAGDTAMAAYTDAMRSLSPWGRLDWPTWGGSPRPADAVSRLRRAKDGGPALVAWSKFLAAKDDASKLGVLELLQRVETGKLSATSLVSGFEYVFYRTLSRGIISAHRELARFSGAGHERLRAEFAAMDKELINLNGAMYAAKVDGAKKPLQGVSVGRAGDLTEMSLLTKETKKQKRHVPIRQLLKRAGKSLQELKPCFMMGPLSVAQYLEQGQLVFDLVVMDEASQLRPEDALGAIARGKQLVVVGDPKQLPPTNFFDRLMDGDDEDPDDAPSVVDGIESILGICEHLYRPVRTLRWHYRSRHESLIAFSNSQFYDGRLVVFPSPYKRNKRLGVNYRYVREGSYQDRRNIPEAQRVVDAVIDHMLSCPEESLGVVTLNQTQRELIEDLLDKKVRNLKGISEYMDHHEKAGWKFFVKNLENVQGDERDVIFVSTTFGKPPGSTAVRQNFGPINRPDGWRRLNVLFTRARRRLDLFTSMQPIDVQVDEKVSLGRRALREYLEFAKTGLLPNVRKQATERDPDSDFELSVADALRNRGFETEAQVGVAGYFIDVGVRHPARRNEFLAGIECDGVTYHSSLSARDRDRIRQEVLESLGWRDRIIRVWSTDWFADPQGQTERLVQFLEQRRTFDLEEPAPYIDEYTQHFEEVEADAVEPPPVEVPVLELLLGRQPVAPLISEAHADVFVEVGDRVTYQSVGGDVEERHTVQIVDSPSNLRLGLLNESTPLAQALLGLCVGDVPELKVQGQATRKLLLLNIDRYPVTELLQKVST